MKTGLIACVLALALAGTSQSFAESSPDPVNIVLDTVLVRPFCLATTIVGSALFVVPRPSSSRLDKPLSNGLSAILMSCLSITRAHSQPMNATKVLARLNSQYLAYGQHA